MPRAKRFIPAFEVIERKDNRLVVRIREGYRSNDVLQYFLQQPATIEGFNEILPSLNDIFIREVEGTSTARALPKSKLKIIETCCYE